MTDDLTGKRGDRVVIDDPHVDGLWWEPARDARVRADHAPFPSPVTIFEPGADIARAWDLASGPDRTEVIVMVKDGSPEARRC